MWYCISVLVSELIRNDFKYLTLPISCKDWGEMHPIMKLHIYLYIKKADSWFKTHNF